MIRSAIAAMAIIFAPADCLASSISPSQPVASWSGLYAGLDAGYGWSSIATGSLNALNAGVLLASFPGIRYDQNGGLVGGHVGYNWHTGPLVFGIELDGMQSHLEGGYADTRDQPGGNFDVTTELKWLLSARGRLGVSADNALFYVTGGVARGATKSALNDHYNAGTLTYLTESTRDGWVVGAGAALKVADNLSLRAEYLHYDLGSRTETFGTGPHVLQTEARYRIDVVRTGLTFHIGDVSRPR